MFRLTYRSVDARTHLKRAKRESELEHLLLGTAVSEERRRSVEMLFGMTECAQPWPFATSVVYGGSPVNVDTNVLDSVPKWLNSRGAERHVPQRWAIRPTGPSMFVSIVPHRDGTRIYWLKFGASNTPATGSIAKEFRLLPGDEADYLYCAGSLDGLPSRRNKPQRAPSRTTSILIAAKLTRDDRSDSRRRNGWRLEKCRKHDANLRDGHCGSFFPSRRRSMTRNQSASMLRVM